MRRRPQPRPTRICQWTKAPTNDHLGNPVNPRLHHYTGAEDPGLWLLQVKDLFQAHKISAAQQGLWMLTDLLEPAITFYFIARASQPAEPELISAATNNRHCAYEYCIQAQIQSLQMQPGNYTTYTDRF